jgi:hypothetical protein
MPGRRHNRTRIFTLGFRFSFTFSVDKTLARRWFFDAVTTWTARLIRKLVLWVRNVSSCLWRVAIRHVAAAFVRLSELVGIGVAVIVANHLAAQLNGQLRLDLPVETLQILVELFAIYLMKKQ